MNKKGQWVDFPYREYGWGERFDNNLNNTSRSATAGYIKINNAGKSIDQAKGTISDTTKTTTTVTTTTGYDKNNPYQAYIEVTYSTILHLTPNFFIIVKIKSENAQQSPLPCFFI